MKTKKWAKVGNGLDNQVRALAKSPDGKLVAGGQFTGGVATFSGLAWVVVGGGVTESGLPAIVRVLKYGADGTLYMGGDFDEVGGSTAVRDIAGYRDGVWNAMAGGFDATYVQSNGTTFQSMGVYDIRVRTNTVYTGGDFDATDGRTVLNLQGLRTRIIVDNLLQFDCEATGLAWKRDDSIRT